MAWEFNDFHLVPVVISKAFGPIAWSAVGVKKDKRYKQKPEVKRSKKSTDCQKALSEHSRAYGVGAECHLMHYLLPTDQGGLTKLY